jgi:hypothetical protein
MMPSFAVLNHLTFSPGSKCQVSDAVRRGRYNTNVAAFETGVTAEYYLNQMPLMAYAFHPAPVFHA